MFEFRFSINIFKFYVSELCKRRSKRPAKIKSMWNTQTTSSVGYRCMCVCERLYFWYFFRSIAVKSLCCIVELVTKHKGIEITATPCLRLLRLIKQKTEFFIRNLDYCFLFLWIYFGSKVSIYDSVSAVLSILSNISLFISSKETHLSQ